MTSPEVLFSLALDLAIAHRGSDPGQIRVLPVLVDNLTEALIPLRALCESTGGRLLDTDDEELQGPVPSTNVALIAPAVEAALTIESAGRSRTARRVVLHRSGNRVDTSFVNPPAGPDPSPGERTVLAVARAALHADLDVAQLAVIAWKDSGVDLRMRTALWNLAVDQFTAMPHPALRTLIVAIETEINIGLHCQPGRGFRFAVQNGRLMRRHGKDSLNATVGQIRDHPGVPVVFLGAGFSVSSHLPLGNALRDQAIRRVLNIDPAEPNTSERLAKRFYDWISAKPGWLNVEEASMDRDVYVKQLTLEQVVRAEKRQFSALPTLQDFREHHDRVIETPGDAVIEFAKVLRLTHGQIVIVEVNFDLLIERHAGMPLRIFASDEDFANGPGYMKRFLAGKESDIPVLKLHGTISDPETCVISDDQTEKGVGKHKLDTLRVLLCETPCRLWIYVGASMRDRDLTRIFLDEDWARGVDEIWVSPYLEGTVESFASSRRPFWRDRNLQTIDDRLISETADSFFEALRQAYERLAFKEGYSQDHQLRVDQALTGGYALRTDNDHDPE